jgi:hypothetical protein
VPSTQTWPPPGQSKRETSVVLDRDSTLGQTPIFRAARGTKTKTPRPAPVAG